MKVEQYVQNLPEMIEKDRVVEDIDLVIQILNGPIASTVGNMAELFDKSKIKSAEVKKIEETAKRLGIIKGASVMAFLFKHAEDLAKGMVVLKTFAEKNLPRRLATAGITYQQAAILRMVELAHFYTVYIRDLVQYYLTYETSATTGRPADISRAQQAEVSDNWGSFNNVVSVLAQMGQTRDSVESFLKNIPEVTVDATTDGPKFMESSTKVDPTLRGFISLRIHPMYYFQSWMAERQANKYRLAKEQMESYELQMLYLENMRNGEDNPTLEKRISEYKDLIAVMKHRMEKLERQHA